MGKKKILFIVSDFYQHGAQRQMHEIDLALDKDKFEITLLSLASLNARADLYDYYYQKHLDLGTKVKFFEDNTHRKKSLIFRVINKLTNNFLINKERENAKRNLEVYLDKFDRVIFMGEYVYQKLSIFIEKNYFKSIFIFIMCSRFQSENFRNLDKTKNYTFASGFENLAQIEHEFEGFKDYNNHFIPLTQRVSHQFKKWSFNDNSKRKIGIFTRLNHDKPLDPFLYAYHLLLQENKNIELHIFGGGDYKVAGYNRYINHLDIAQQVHFRGHQSDMKQAIIDEKLDLVWFQGYNNHPAGYAAFETTLTGVPQLFWDFFPGINDSINAMDVIYPHFKNLLSFVKASENILFDKEVATILSEKQFADVIENRDILKHIHVIEYLLLAND